MPAENKDQVSEILTGIKSIIENKEAPAHTGKAVFEKDLDFCKMKGADNFAKIFGKSSSNKSDELVMPLNFGLKKDVGHMPDDVRMRLFNFKKMVSDCEIEAQFRTKQNNVTPQMMMETEAYKRIQPMLKAYNVTDFATWIPTIQARFYFDEYEIPSLLASEFETLPMDNTTITIPIDLGYLEGQEEGDNSVFNAQSTTSDGDTATARNNVVHTEITEDLMSDNSPIYIDVLRRKVLLGGVRSFERCLINGDITGSPRGASHQDSDIAAMALNACKFQKAFNGVRKIALANSANGSVYNHQGDSVSKGLFEGTLMCMGDFADEVDDLLWIVPSFVKTKLITGAIPELFTAFAYGGLASNVTGQCPPVFGIKVLSSQFVRKDLNASGVYAAASNLTHISLIKKSRFKAMLRQATRIWAAPSLPSSDKMLMTAKTRHTFVGNKQSATETSCVIGVNLSK